MDTCDRCPGRFITLDSRIWFICLYIRRGPNFHWLQVLWGGLYPLLFHQLFGG